MNATITWEGAEALRPFLVAIDTLEPFPGNPRRGDVAAVVESLRRFGQPRPILIDGDGTRIVAGHHVRLAALELGWTHIAAIPNEFKSEDEARAFLLADNRTHDLGLGYDTELLVEQLQHLAAEGGVGLDGTGYDLSDLERYMADLDKQPAPSEPASEDPPDPQLHELVLMYSRRRRNQALVWIDIIEKEKGVDGPSAAVYEALKMTAAALNSA